MADQITDDEIATLKRLERAATPGPWETAPMETTDNFNVISPDGYDDPWYICQCDSFAADASSENNAALIAAARNALPKLLAEREADKAEIERLTGILGHVRDHLTADENFDADELRRDIEGSTDLAEYDRMSIRATAAERRLAEAEGLVSETFSTLSALPSHVPVAGLREKVAAFLAKPKDT